MFWVNRAKWAGRFLGHTLLGAARSPFSPGQFGIRRGYFHRLENAHFDDTANQDHYQREVYERARDLMRTDHLRTVVDVGCGSGYKLTHILGEFDTTGIDVDPAYTFLCKQYPDRRWLKAFSEPANNAQAELVICADVIEHVPDPDALLQYLRTRGAKWIVLSTPARELVRRWPVMGALDYGPPGNPCHIREWTFAELGAYVRQHLDVVEHVVTNRAHATQMIVARGAAR